MPSKITSKLKPTIKIRVYQTNFSPGFAFYQTGRRLSKTGKAIVGLDIGNLLALAADNSIDAKELPYIVAQVLMHEVFHVLEEWAGVEFSEARVDKLCRMYARQYGKRKGRKGK